MSWSDLVVLSHLRWSFVWQRPQHVISRLAQGRPTWFVEQPIATGVSEPILRCQDHGSVTQVWLEVPGPGRHYEFDDEAAASYGADLRSLLGWSSHRAVWLYTPMALDVARVLEPSLLVYDVMDDLASFKDAPPMLRTRHRQVLAEADVVFAGGRSLHQGLVEHRPDAHLFPSGVETEHFLGARARRPPRLRPVAGYVGVIDERIDLDLLAGLAPELDRHGWDVEMVGPVVKIDPTSLPEAPNLRYVGATPYSELPTVMAGFDVAVMPFALNEATRSISPTKTLEFLAAGLPVVSTRVPDVVADYAGVVALADDAAEFARCCREAGVDDPIEQDRAVWPLLRRQHWDAVASRMAGVMHRANVAAMAASGDSA